jgi:CRP/FNR family transcriptional regulator
MINLNSKILDLNQRFICYLAALSKSTKPKENFYMPHSQSIIINSCSIGSNKMECMGLLKMDELSLIESKMVEVTYQKGEVISKQGSFVSHIMVLNEGLIKTFIEGSTDNLILQIFSPVSMIGLSSLFEGNQILYYSAQAYVESQVSLIEINAFKQVMNSNPSFATKMLSLLAEQSNIINGRFYCLTKKQTYGRLADVVLCLANRVYKTKKFPLQLSRKDFAELSGMSIESIARILTKFKADGLINITNEHVEIIDSERLEMVSMKG